MADVDIVVDSGDLKAAIDLLKDYDMSFTKMVNKVQNEGNRLSRASKATASQVEQAWENAQRVLEDNKIIEASKKQQQTLKQFGVTFRNISKENIRSAKEEGQALKDLGKSAEELLREKVKLAAAYNPLLAAEQRYLDVKNRIARAVQLGVVDAKQETIALKNLEREYQALNKGVYLAGSRFNQFGEQSGIAGKSANRFGVYAQQAGYQVGDFAVQLQSGTNAGVAFSQQAAQLAGLIPGVAGAVTTFAAIGLGLLIQNLTDSEKEASKLDEVISNFEKYEGIFESAGATLEDSFVTAIEKVREEYGDLVADIAKSDIRNSTKGLIKDLGKDFKRGSLADPNDTKGFFEGLYGSFGLSDSGAVEENIRQMNEYNKLVDAAQNKLKEMGEQTYITSEELALSMDAFFTGIKNSGEYSVDTINRVMSTLKEAGIDEVLVKIGQQQEEQNKAAEELLATTQQETEMRLLALKYGEDSVQVRLAELDAEHAKTLATIEALDVTSALKAELEAAAEANYAAESATIAWGNSLGYVKDQIAGIASILSSIGGGIISNAEKFTTAKLIQEGATRVEAEKQVRYASEDRKYELQKQQNLSQYGSIIGPALNVGLSLQHEGGRNADEALLAAYELDAERTKAAKGSGKGKGGSGKSKKPKKSEAEKDAEKATEKLEKFFDQFKKGVEQQERLLGVYGEQREELEKVIEIENRLGDARHLVSQKQIEAMANEELALERRLEREQQLYELGSQNVENLLMAVVSGTSSIEDAFRGMLANIVSEIYQQYVAKGAADWAGNALVSLFSAKGNAFGTGGVKMFANGGVVNAPTLFGYNNGKTGMMGEAGPEAIMPLKRNSQGKLGVEVSGNSSNPINISNVFNVSANGDESVKRIIETQIPRITQASKMAVIEGRRRNERGL